MQSIVKAGANTGRLEAKFLSIQAKITLHHGAIFAKLWHIERTGGQAGETANALGLIHHDDPVFEPF
jgi:hypothetical protein